MSRRARKASFRRKVRKKNAYRGCYKGISYRSSLELAFILRCHDTGETVVNSELSLPYVFKDKDRHYFPDFLVGGREVVEVKALGFLFEKKKLQIEAKKKALEAFCEKNPAFTSKFVTDKMIENKYKKQAKIIARKEEMARWKKKT